VQAADLAITLRRRSAWEAMDLGVTMLQRWWRTVYAAHLAVSAPIMAAAIAFGWFTGRAWLGVFLIWWLKPVYDRVVLHVLSRAVFGQHHDVRAVFASAKDWLNTGIFSALFLRAIWFDLVRSFTLPVRQLEGQSGRAARERRSVLGRRVGSYAIWLTLVCSALEILVLWTSFGLLASLFLPATADTAQGGFWDALFGAGEDGAPLFEVEDMFSYAAAVLVLEPFYVAAGFALYLNRRTLLEGWDIEVALRRIAQRYAAAAMVLIAAFAAAPQAEAQEKDPGTEIREVLKAKEFGYYKDVQRWERRDREQAQSGDYSWLRAIGTAIAKAGEVLLWIVAGALIAYALWWAARLAPRARDPTAAAYTPPAALFGMELAPEKLPADVGVAAAALAREGKLREALGLLYRGALSELVHKRGVRLAASHTEGEAVRLAGLAYFSTLVDAWQRCAYASRAPSTAEVERLARDYAGAFA
jgi:hypothetical protein